MRAPIAIALLVLARGAALSATTLARPTPGVLRAPGVLTAPVDELRSALGEARTRAVWRCLREGRDPACEVDAPELSRATREVLAGAYGGGPAAKATESSTAADGTTKLLVEFDGRDAVEAVLIPQLTRGRATTTVCVSSQVGCAMGCAFCATGRMGLVRSLSGGEIVAQIWLALRAARATGGALPAPRQIVFMGMGDAGANHVEAALAAFVLTDGDRFGFSKRRLTLSTVGPSPRAFKALAAAPGTLAWSLHAVDEGLRKALVPSAAHSPRELRDGLLDALAGSPETGPLMLAVTLLAGVNDGAGDAAALAAFVAPIRAARSKTIVDLIPYNPLPGDDAFARPSFARVAAFQRTLRDSSPGLFVGVRSARGDDERAACGQLATDAAARAREPS